MKNLINLLLIITCITAYSGESDITKTAGEYVFKVEIEKNGMLMGIGTAFYATYKGNTFLLSAAHVCDVGSIYIHKKKVEILEIDKKADICIIKTKENKGIPVHPFSPEPLEKVISIGFAGGSNKVATFGFLRDILKRTVCEDPRILKDCNVIEAQSATLQLIGGMSGGPVINGLGNVIGINMYSGQMWFPDAGFATHSSIIKILNKHVK